MSQPKKLLWIDLETTGLNPAKDLILEVAVAIAWFENPLDPIESHHLVLPADPEAHEVRTCDPVVRDMHQASGLWAECFAAREKGSHHGRTESISEFETLILRKILPPDPDDREMRPVLAGSTVHFDKAFLPQIFPRLALALSHRTYDVSAVKLFCQSLGMPKLAKGEAHRAGKDLDETIEHARLCEQWLRAYQGRVSG